MKNIKAFAAALLFSISLLFINCTPSTDQLPTKQEVISNGKWQVNYFESGANLTADYQNLQLVFNANGTFNLVDGVETTSGIWNVSNDNILQLYINTHNHTLLQLNGDWNINECNNNVLNLQKNKAGTAQLKIIKI
jgi:hypothetical protein